MKKILKKISFVLLIVAFLFIIIKIDIYSSFAEENTMNETLTMDDSNYCMKKIENGSDSSYQFDNSINSNHHFQFGNSIRDVL